MENTRLIDYASTLQVDGPTVVLDLDIVEQNYRNLERGFNRDAHIYYAVKANPNIEILKRLKDLGSCFDAASRGEIERLLSIGVHPAKISYGNTIKKKADIQWAYSKGISLFAADSEEELEKIAEVAPQSDVFIRMLVRSTEAEWPLSRKFGCSSSMVIPLLKKARELQLFAIGLSFHVGSQTRHPYMWDETLDLVTAIWNNAREKGFHLRLLNIGGGFPTFYNSDVTEPFEYAQYLTREIKEKFEGLEYLMAEPGRGLVGNAGVLVTEVVLVSRKNEDDELRWVYLDVGKFHGLAETEGEAIKYRLKVINRDDEAESPCVVAGPTCDSADVLYETNLVDLPVNLRSGDRILILSTGAYTTTYSSVWFNGFEPLKEVIYKP